MGSTPLSLGERLPVSALRDDPYPFFSQLRREAPVWRLPDENAYLVSTWDLVAEATARVDDFSNHFRYTLFRHDDGTLGALETGALGPDVFAGADPPVHTAHRRIFFPELVQKKIDALEPYVAALTDELLDVMLSEEICDAALGLAHPLPMRVVADKVIGFRDPDVDQIRRWVFDGSLLMGGLLTLDQMGPLGLAVSAMADWTRAQLEQALQSPPTDDVLSATAVGVRDGRLTPEEAAFTLMVLVGAGAETTTSLIGNAIGLLAENRLLQDELRADPGKVAPFIEEVIRFESPFRFHPRTTRRRVDLGEVAIPEGALVMLLWSAANRDEAVFERPDEIKLGRPNVHRHFGFGRGIHHCVGAPLARLEARVVLTGLLERTRSFVSDPDRTPRWADSLWIRRHEQLPLVAAIR
jgi:cytochrome P450